MSDSTSEVTSLLVAWSEGDESALPRLLPVVMEELKRIADRYLRREGREHTLQPTALVNELYLKLIDRRSVQWKNRSQFFGVAAEMMRNILVDYARSRQAARRGAGMRNLSLDETLAAAQAEEQDEQLLALDEGLKALSEVDPRQARVVELRFFTGLAYEEIGEVMGISVRTAKREWRTARLWLLQRIKGV